MSGELPDHTCPDIDALKLLLKGKLSAEDEADAYAMLEELRESNRLLRSAAEDATEKAELASYSAAESFGGFYLN